MITTLQITPLKSYLNFLIIIMYQSSKKLGIVEGNGKVGIFLVIIIVVVGLYIYRRWKKGKKLISFGFRKKSR